jgi:hypothetical protein
VFGDGEPSDYHVWKQFPFDAPDVNLRIEMTSLTVKNFPAFRGWKVRHNLHEYYGPGGDSESVRGESIVERLQRQRLMLSFKKSADTLASFDIYHIGIEAGAYTRPLLSST